MNIVTNCCRFSAGLTNCVLFQCNLSYFRGAFDVGVSLHACGTATDLVMCACVDAGAHFVCCPCCYGSVARSRDKEKEDGDAVRYPRSEKFLQEGGWKLEVKKTFFVTQYCE